MWSEILDVLKEKESTVHSSQFSDWRFDNLSGSHHQSQVHLTLMMTSASSALNSDDDFRLGCRNVSHHYRQQSFSGLHSPGRSNYTITCYPRVQTIYCTKSPVILSRRSAANVPRTKNHWQSDLKVRQPYYYNYYYCLITTTSWSWVWTRVKKG